MDTGSYDITLRANTKYKIIQISCKNKNAYVYKDWKATHKNEYSFALGVFLFLVS